MPVARYRRLTLFRYAIGSEVRPRAGWPQHKSVVESLAVIRTVFGGDTMWALELMSTGEAIGCVKCLTAEHSNLSLANEHCEVGYWISRPYWGKGICTEAMRMVGRHCFDEKGFTALWGVFFPTIPPWDE